MTIVHACAGGACQVCHLPDRGEIWACQACDQRFPAGHVCPHD